MFLYLSYHSIRAWLNRLKWLMRSCVHSNLLYIWKDALTEENFFSFFFSKVRKSFFFSKMASGGKMLFGNVWVAVIEWGLDQYISIPKKCFYMQMEFWSKVRLSHQILISLVTLKLWLVSWTYFYWICWVLWHRLHFLWLTFIFRKSMNMQIHLFRTAISHKDSYIFSC